MINNSIINSENINDQTFDNSVLLAMSRNHKTLDCDKLLNRISSIKRTTMPIDLDISIDCRSKNSKE